MKKAYFLAIALCFSTPALAQSLPERTGVNSMMGIAPKTDDFIQSVSWSDLFEIQSSQMALSDPSLKTFASRMIADHQKTSAELKQLLSVNNMAATPPASVDDTHKRKLDTLHGLHGDSFIRQYRKDQISAHEDALSLFRRYAKSGENEALKKWAGDTIPTLEEHLKMAESLSE
ncbi:DUF4142 domain-containing protein [Acetobacter senegalensis]|uniref:DUF4142 domain-containing protein n=1 Tax=Acetobacter senegalensis TaxID=446692 RepID=UPI001EDC3737|nr:DUF4142 domain-containing protein [Acetobacter senegalensis]MCG4255294.1 DUF4142 domain-containing protein [Acetobacter senegalensis]MCG4274566.1 DUF4142 domain-containing protein [Acetobacter senegalensis]